jgi:CheY-like chemotaxis protein
LIAVTGWGQNEDRHQAALAGFDHHLTKPVDFERLLELVGAARTTNECAGPGLAASLS